MARSAKQAVAIRPIKARRAGVKLWPPKKGAVSEENRIEAIPGNQDSTKEGRSVGSVAQGYFETGACNWRDVANLPDPQRHEKPRLPVGTRVVTD